MTLPPFRIGEGWDIHALVPGRRLVIGGVDIPTPWACSGTPMQTCCCMR